MPRTKKIATTNVDNTDEDNPIVKVEDIADASGEPEKKITFANGTIQIMSEEEYKNIKK